jgi:hypothetical protein
MRVEDRRYSEEIPDDSAQKYVDRLQPTTVSDRGLKTTLLFHELVLSVRTDFPAHA